MNGCHKCGKQTGVFYAIAGEVKLTCADCRNIKEEKPVKEEKSDPLAVWSVF